MKSAQLRFASLVAAIAAAAAMPAAAGELPEGDAAKPVQVSQKSRAQVHKEAVAWVASGMTHVNSGDRQFDTRGPAQDQARYAFAQQMGGNSTAVAQGK